MRMGGQKITWGDRETRPFKDRGHCAPLKTGATLGDTLKKNEELRRWGIGRQHRMRRSGNEEMRG
jgi:hypothetical protein